MRRLAFVLLLSLGARLAAEEVVGRPADDPKPGEPPIELTVVADGDSLSRLYLPIEIDGARRFTIVDCGTARFWIRAPQGEGRGEWVDDAFVATLGGRRLHVLGRRVPEFHETIDGECPVGAVGNDYLLAGALVLDLARGALQRLPRGTEVPEATDWPSVPIALERGMILLDVTFDGTRARVMLDTGAPKTVWVGRRGKDGDEVGETHDVHGERLLYWLGTVSLGIGSETRTVPVQRMEWFPHLEEVAEALGQKVDGLVGLSALGRRRVVLDPTAKTLRLEPEKASK